MKAIQVLIWTLLSSIFTLILTACSSPAIQQPASAEAQQVQAETEIARADSAQAVASRSSASSNNSNILNEQRLGTKWGDDISSPITQVALKRLSSSPVSETQIRYAGKQFSGRSINSISLAAGKVSFAVLDGRGRTLPLYREDQQYFLSANEGQSYVLKYSNSSAQTYEIVASVDGLDVINGQRASRYNSGYVLRPYSSLEIEGFRKSNDAVASFTFSKPKDAYAAHSASGSIYNTGVIGTAVYELNAPRGTAAPAGRYAPAPNAFPGD